LVELSQGERHTASYEYPLTAGVITETREFINDGDTVTMIVTRQLPHPGDNAGTCQVQTEYRHALDRSRVVDTHAGNWVETPGAEKHTSVDTYGGHEIYKGTFYDWRIGEGAEEVPEAHQRPYTMTVVERGSVLSVNIPTGPEGDGLYAMFEICNGVPTICLYSNDCGDMVAKVVPRYESARLDIFPEGMGFGQGIEVGKRPYPGDGIGNCEYPVMSIECSCEALYADEEACA